jgi:Na+-translocating ferredoxin:NAD+ oxidoreductase RnfE subunit
MSADDELAGVVGLCQVTAVAGGAEDALGVVLAAVVEDFL